MNISDRWGYKAALEIQAGQPLKEIESAESYKN